MSEDYQWWNETLATHLLQERPGRPFFLYVDRGVLADACGSLDEDRAFAEFLEAVRARCVGASPFAWARREMRAWQASGSPGNPPFIAVLGLTVLAAAERSTTHFQYYDDLNMLLGKPALHGMPKDFDIDVPALFRAWNGWLESERRFGTPTASTPTHYTNVGWPLSQALLRPSDGHALHEAIRRSGLRGLSSVAPEQLLTRVAPALRLLPESASRSRLVDALDRHPELLRDRIERELLAWADNDDSRRGVVDTRIQLKLAHDLLYGDWWFAARRPAESEYQELRIRDWTASVAGRGAIEVEHPDPWELLGRGEVGQIDGKTPVYAPAAGPKWLRKSTDVGGWIEQPAADFSVEQLRLLPQGAPEAALLESLGLHAEDSAPDGWSVWAVPAGTEVPGRMDRTTPVRRPALEGGLCLEPRTNTYLATSNGRPWLTGVDDGETLTLDGQVLRVEEARASMKELRTGAHTIDSAGVSVNFRLLPQVRDDLFAAPVVSWTRVDSSLTVAVNADDGDSDVVAEGALINGLSASDVVTEIPYRVNTIWVIGSHGEVAKRQVRPLTWLDLVGLQAASTDPRRGLSGLDFRAAFAVAFRSAASPAFVVEVDTEPSSQGRDREVTSLEHKQLVQQLLTSGHQVLPPDVEKRWKRAVAAVMKAGPQ